MDFLSIYKRFNNSIQTPSTSNFVEKRNGKNNDKHLKNITSFMNYIIAIYYLQDIDEFLVNVKSRTYSALASTAKQTFQMTAAIVAQHTVVII